VEAFAGDFRLVDLALEELPALALEVSGACAEEPDSAAFRRFINRDFRRAALFG
jgi:hypothetical protein